MATKIYVVMRILHNTTQRIQVCYNPQRANEVIEAWRKEAIQPDIAEYIACETLDVAT